MGKSVRVKKGTEVLEIDSQDLPFAVNDGYLPTERLIVSNPKTKESFEIDPNDYQNALKDGFSFQDVAVEKKKTQPSFGAFGNLLQRALQVGVEAKQAAPAPEPVSKEKESPYGALGQFVLQAAKTGKKIQEKVKKDAFGVTPFSKLEEAYQQNKAATSKLMQVDTYTAYNELPQSEIDKYNATIEPEINKTGEQIHQQRQLIKPIIASVSADIEKDWSNWTIDGVPDYERIYNAAGALSKQYGGGDFVKEDIANSMIAAAKRGNATSLVNDRFKQKTGFTVNEYVERTKQKGVTDADVNFINKTYEESALEVGKESQEAAEALSEAMPLINKVGGAFISALQGGIASQGSGLAALGLNSNFTDYLRGFKTKAELTQMPTKEWNKHNLLTDPLGTVLPFVAQQTGFSLPGLVGSLGVGLATGSGPAGAMVSILSEKAANVGETYEQLIASGVPQEEAQRRSAELMKPMITDAMNFVEMGVLLRGIKGKGSIIANTALGGFSEVPPEIEQQYWQAKAINPDLTPEQFVKENDLPMLALQTFVSSSAMSGGISVAGKTISALSKVPGAVIQKLQNTIKTSGPDVAKETVRAQFEDGTISKEEAAKIESQVDQIKETEERLEEFNLTPEQSRATTVFSLMISELEQQQKTEKNPAVLAKINSDLKQHQADLDAIISGEKGVLWVKTENGDEYFVIENKAKEFVEEASEEIENGDISVEPVGNIEVKIPEVKKEARRVPKVKMELEPPAQIQPDIEIPEASIELIEGRETGEAAPVTVELEVPGEQEVFDISKKSDADIENRMSEIELNTDDKSRQEFNTLEKEMEQRERKSVFGVPLDKAEKAIDALIKKDKEQPNGFGSFLERRDASESKDVIRKYLTPYKISDEELKADFVEAAIGNPDTWYAHGLKLRESLKEAARRGIETQELVEEVEKIFIKDGYTSQDAKETVARKLAPIFKDSQAVNENTFTVVTKEGRETGEATSTPIELDVTEPKVTIKEGFDIGPSEKNKAFSSITDIENNEPIKSVVEYVSGLTGLPSEGKTNSKYFNTSNKIGGKEVVIRVSDHPHTADNVRAGRHTVSIIVNGENRDGVTYGDDYTEIRITANKKNIEEKLSEIDDFIESIPQERAKRQSLKPTAKEDTTPTVTTKEEPTVKEEARDEPKVYLTKDDVEERTNWGEKYTALKENGSTLRGKIVEREELPTELYHVTTASSKLNESGMLKHIPADNKVAGLGKGTSKNHWGVSLTSNKESAETIERELKRAVELANDEDKNGAEILKRIAKEDSERTGIDLSKALNNTLSSYEFHKNKGQKYSAFQDFKHYLNLRESAGAGENPILFGDGESFKKINPNEIGIVTVNPQNIPSQALIRQNPIGSNHLNEVMVHSDIPITKAKQKEIGKPKPVKEPSKRRIPKVEGVENVQPEATQTQKTADDWMNSPIDEMADALLGKMSKKEAIETIDNGIQKAKNKDYSAVKGENEFSTYMTIGLQKISDEKYIKKLQELKAEIEKRSGKKEGEKYVFKPLMDLDLKTWRLSSKETDVTEKFTPTVSEPTQPKVDALKDVESTAKALEEQAAKKPVRFLPDDKVILSTKDGKEVEVNFRGYNNSSETKAVIFGDRGSGIGQMEVDASQLRRKSKSDKLSEKERNALMGKIDLEKTKYWGKGLSAVSDAELIDLASKHPKWDKLTQKEKQDRNDFETATTPIQTKAKQEWGENAPESIVNEIKAEHEKAISNIIWNEKYAPQLAEAYHKAKKDGTNPELVKAVEDVLGTTQSTNKPTPKVTEQPTPEVKKGVTEEVQPSTTRVGEGRTTGGTSIPKDGDTVTIVSKTDKKGIEYFYRDGSWRFLDSRGKEQKEVESKQEEIGELWRKANPFYDATSKRWTMDDVKRIKAQGVAPMFGTKSNVKLAQAGEKTESGAAYSAQYIADAIEKKTKSIEYYGSREDIDLMMALSSHPYFKEVRVMIKRYISSGAEGETRINKGEITLENGFEIATFNHEMMHILTSGILATPDSKLDANELKFKKKIFEITNKIDPKSEYYEQVFMGYEKRDYPFELIAEAFANRYLTKDLKKWYITDTVMVKVSEKVKIPKSIIQKVIDAIKELFGAQIEKYYTKESYKSVTKKVSAFEALTNAFMELDAINITPERYRQINTQGNRLYFDKTKEGERIIKEKGKEVADWIRTLRPPSNLAQSNIFGLPIAIYDTAIVAIANAVEGGATIAQAIADAIADIKKQFPKWAEEKEFEETITKTAGFETWVSNVLKQFPDATLEEIMEAIEEDVPSAVNTDYKRKQIETRVQSVIDRTKKKEEVSEIAEEVEVGEIEEDDNSVLDGIATQKKLDDIAQKVEGSGVIKQYMSGDSIRKYNEEEPENNQDYDSIVLQQAAQQGRNLLAIAKELYGDKYVTELLKYAKEKVVSNEVKALIYVQLENDLIQQKRANPDRAAEIQKLQNLVRADNQAHARSNAIALGLMRLRDLVKYGFSPREVMDKMFSPEERKKRKKLNEAVETAHQKVNEIQSENLEVNKKDKKKKEADIAKAAEEQKAKQKTAPKATRKRSSKKDWQLLAQRAKELPDMMKGVIDKINKLDC